VPSGRYLSLRERLQIADLLRIFAERTRIDNRVRGIRIDVGIGKEIPVHADGACFLRGDASESFGVVELASRAERHGVGKFGGAVQAHRHPALEVGGKLDFLEPLEECAIREAREEIGVEIRIEGLLCVTDHRLPDENQHWISPAFLGRIVSGEARNCEPNKTREVRWFPFGELPPNLTITARKAIEAYAALTLPA